MRELIFGLARPVLRLLRQDERGTVGVLVAILISGGVLLGVGALALDAGQLYQARAELQNGAEAAALAVARSCANGGTCDNPTGTGVASSYITSNASVLTSGTAAGTVCGSGSLGTCTPDGSMVSCPANPAGNVNYVDVNTSASVSATFARAMGFSASNVKACAQVEWGAAQSATTLALTISICEWNSLTQNGNLPWGTNIPIYLQGNGVPACSGPGGSQIPGGFGWLCLTGGSGGSCNGSTGSSTCTGIIDLLTNTTYSNPGLSTPSGCGQALQQLITSGSVVYIPVFDSASGSGNGSGGPNSGTFHITGLAAFVVVGYSNLPSGSPKDFGTYNLCTLKNPCIEGHFTQALVPVGDPPGPGTDFGATVIRLTG